MPTTLRSKEYACTWGSMKTFINHASWVFSNAAARREEYNTRATACLSLAGIRLTVRTGSSQIASKFGRGLGIAPVVLDGDKADKRELLLTKEMNKFCS